MPMKRRIDKSRDTRITARGIELFERLQRLRRTQNWSPEIRDLSCELDAEIGIKPWNANPALDCDDDEPPSWMDDREKVEDWWRSREIRLELEEALRERRRARRRAAQRAEPSFGSLTAN